MSFTIFFTVLLRTGEIMSKKLQELLGRFAQQSESFKLTDVDGNPMDTIEAGVTVVHGPFKLRTKDQIARVTGIVTEGMLNAKNDQGENVYEFQGNGWRPQAKVGDILLQDVENSDDRWACGPDLFGGTGWTGTATDDLSVTYAKPGKPLLTLEVPEGTPIKSREGTRPAPAGCLLAITKSEKGDFYAWTADVVEAYVRDYVETS
jgi:hypothetical protein